ncbi:MAG: hypothetical protein HN731_04245, partial [Rhodospirillaceae bacterium]|nr:hypothetical protein [Rhodospirillaceae bacterium]
MYAAISPSSEAITEPKKIIVDGKAQLTFAANDKGDTRLKNLFQSDPVRILFPNAPKEDISQAVVVTTSGGLVGGDKIAIEIEAEAGASALV